MNGQTLDREDYAGCNKSLVHTERDFTQRYLYQLRGGYGPCPAMPTVERGVSKEKCVMSPRQAQMNKARNNANSKRAKK